MKHFSCVGLAVSIIACAVGVHAQPPSLQSGAVESGFSGALTVVEGTKRGSAGVDGSFFFHAPGGLASATTEVAYAHDGDLDLLDLSALAGWTRAVSSTSLYPFVALAAGVRQEWVGSFSDTRYPVGFDLGVRALVSQHADVRIAYRLRRVLGDPVEDFTEHELRLGIGLLFRNTPPRHQ